MIADNANPKIWELVFPYVLDRAVCEGTHSSKRWPVLPKVVKDITASKLYLSAGDRDTRECDKADIYHTVGHNQRPAAKIDNRNTLLSVKLSELLKRAVRLVVNVWRYLYNPA